jgi:hypothetical protein
LKVLVRLPAATDAGLPGGAVDMQKRA